MEETLTRTEAIAHIVSMMTKMAVDAGAELATILGPDTAATLTIRSLEYDLRAFEAVGITEADIREAAEFEYARRERQALEELAGF